MKLKIMLRSKAKTLSPILRIGKLGFGDSVVSELRKLLKKRKLVKIKLLPSYLEGKNKKEVIEQIVQKTNSELIESVGNVVVLYKEK